MFAANSDVWAPGDSFGIPTTSDVNRVPHQRYQLDPPSLIVGAAGLLALMFLTHHLGKKGKKR